jgi:hypothetical protein
MISSLNKPSCPPTISSVPDFSEPPASSPNGQTTSPKPTISSSSAPSAEKPGEG